MFCRTTTTIQLQELGGYGYQIFHPIRLLIIRYTNLLILTVQTTRITFHLFKKSRILGFVSSDK